MPAFGFESTSICVIEQDDLQYVAAIHYQGYYQGLHFRVETIIILDKYGCVVDWCEDEA